MFRSIFHNCGKIYLKTLPTMMAFSGTAGLLTGIGNYHYDTNNTDKNNINKISNAYVYMIGYTFIGILTGITYPISFPLCAYCVFTPLSNLTTVSEDHN